MDEKWGKRAWTAACAIALSASGAASGQTRVFDANAILALHRAGLSSGAIVAKVRASPCGWDTSTERLIAWKQAGLDDAIIVAMVEQCPGTAPPAGTAPPPGGNTAATDPAARHPPGIYLMEGMAGSPRLHLLRPTAISGLRITGNGSLLFPRMAHASLPQAAAQTVAPDASPVFYFYFNHTDRAADGFGEAAAHDAQSPNEFSLVRFHIGSGARQFSAGRVQAYATTTGVDPKDTMPFTIVELGEGKYQVTVAKPLPPGEYGFVLAGEGKSQKQLYRIFDFAVHPEG